MKLLRIDSSARRNSVSRKLTARFTESWEKEHPGGAFLISYFGAGPLSLDARRS